MAVGLIMGKTLTETEAMRKSPLALAYIGDGVFSLYVRAMLVLSSEKNAGALHRESIKYVSARAQAKFAQKVLPHFTQNETDVFMRGRNAKSATVPKNMSVADYRHATAIEAVIGYLYLTGDEQRLLELFSHLEL